MDSVESIIEKVALYMHDRSVQVKEIRTPCFAYSVMDDLLFGEIEITTRDYCNQILAHMLETEFCNSIEIVRNKTSPSRIVYRVKTRKHEVLNIHTKKEENIHL